MDAAEARGYGRFSSGYMIVVTPALIDSRTGSAFWPSIISFVFLKK